MGEVVTFDAPTLCDIPAAQILDAVPRDLSECMVIGWEASGELWVSSTTSDRGAILLLLELAKKVSLED